MVRLHFGGSWLMKILPERAEAPSGDERGCYRTGTKGQAAVEFALALPLLLMILTATLIIGVALYNDLQLTFATTTGGQLLSISRGQTTDPCKTTSQAVYQAAPYLNPSNLKFTIVLGGTTVTSNSANPSCSGSQQYLVENQSAQVTATYPCNLKIFGFTPAGSCVLTAQTTVMIQ
jgi:Flp pilus assembly protein TadG